jgi:DNA-binding CsgD family transcriptional regulator
MPISALEAFITRPIRRDDLDLLSAIPGLACSVRDDHARLKWANHTYSREVFGSDSVPASRLGRDLHDIVSDVAADERQALQRQVINTGTPALCYQLHCDRRALAVVLPLDPESFGHAGVLSVSNLSPGGVPAPYGDTVHTLRTPAKPGQLALLTRRELEVLYLCAQGLSVPQIAEKLFRSTKTMENHIRSIHIKLGIRGRGDLVRYCVERGLHAFKWEEWLDIIDHLESAKPSGLDD